MRLLMENWIKPQNEVVILIVFVAYLLNYDLSSVSLNSVIVCHN